MEADKSERMSQLAASEGQHEEETYFRFPNSDFFDVALSRVEFDALLVRTLAISSRMKVRVVDGGLVIHGCLIFGLALTNFGTTRVFILEEKSFLLSFGLGSTPLGSVPLPK